MSGGEDRWHHPVRLPAWLDKRQITRAMKELGLDEEAAKDYLFRLDESTKD